MIRRVLVTLAALAVGIVVFGPVGETLVYGLESFPVGADTKGVARIVSATGSIVLLLVGVAAGAQVRGRARGWPVVAAGLLVAGLLAAYAPLDADSAFGELHPLVRPLAALVGGIVLGAVAVAVLPASPADGDPWPIAALTAGLLVNLAIAPDLLPRLPELRQLGWADVLALVLATAAAILVRPAEEARTPGLVAVSRIALVGAVVGAVFHMQYADRAVAQSPAAVAVLVLVGTLAVWLGMTWWLVGWSGRAAGTDAARFALVCAGATGALFTASGRNLGIAWTHDFIPLLGVVAAIAGVLLARRLPAVPWDAAGLVVVSLLTLVLATTQSDGTALAMFGMPFAAFTLAAALARTSAAGALCGLVTLVLTLPPLISLITQSSVLVNDEVGQPSRVQLAVTYAPMWLVGLATAALLVVRRRPAGAAPQPLAVG
ncbi:hypothetical protein Ais01nite_44400 [Asanoa ishikariensis]|uniref:Uncharacterized protein n=1 Tax=Asanoa ishikariensis TaxID=137265 RepID=A0A1H3S820_9ACTN|nr:hypothetical protein [Asanoa ishikariensis]GIF66405.1 hypothetical protein Ais01nite_44400 [Asanoa ishikariensis]SDZ33735.1 hypothetical protein SAMN05421684_4643 [Asanoa ishikariensis]